MSGTLEQKARTVGGNSKLLAIRLKAARSCLTNECKAYFKSGRFDYANKRLVSECGQYDLQWSVRDYPKTPISYENQQTSIGSVILIRLGEAVGRV